MDHPVMLSECPQNPPNSRAKMLELLFEGYGVPSVQLGSGGGFAWAHARRMGRVGRDGVVLSVGHSAAHVIAVVGGEPSDTLCRRSAFAGRFSVE